MAKDKAAEPIVYGVLILIAIIAGAFIFCGNGRCADFGASIDKTIKGESLSPPEEQDQAAMYGGYT